MALENTSLSLPTVSSAINKIAAISLDPMIVEEYTDACRWRSSTLDSLIKASSLKFESYIEFERSRLTTTDAYFESSNSAISR